MRPYDPMGAYAGKEGFGVSAMSSTSVRSGNFASVAIASAKRISWRACVDALTYCTLAAKRELNLL